jgi:nitroimidazol reductase NimA-like FMN-containing flavoprotein (pyridoxamine 5'-phosphate oxidase superfamily)
VGELVVLDREECLALLARNQIGRLSVNVGGGAPAIRPVNYVFDERSQSIIFRSDHGSKLFGLATSGRAAFEVDGIDPVRQTGWSVIVVGVAQEIRDRFELRRLERAGLEPWASGPKSHWLRIRTQLVSGRRIVGDTQRVAADQ